MPYYRITIWLKDSQLSQGIRYFENSNIDAVTNIARVKAKEHFGENKVSDVEAAMLSNHCTSVKEYLAKQNKIRKNKVLNYSSNSNGGRNKSRKSTYSQLTTTLADREKIEKDQNSH